MKLVFVTIGASTAVNYSASISAELMHLAKVQSSFQLKKKYDVFFSQMFSICLELKKKLFPASLILK